MSVDFWLNLQQRWDLYHAMKAEAPALEAIHQYQAGGRPASAG